MAKQQKYNLFFEEESNYEIIGICSHHRDYRLVWGLNEYMKLQLSKAEKDFAVYSKKGQLLSTHPYYEQRDKEHEMDFYLIKNKVNGKFLIPERQQIDYFLFVLNNLEIEMDVWVEKLKLHPGVLTAIYVDASDLKSTENIIF
jgi:hypothetical protein